MPVLWIEDEKDYPPILEMFGDVKSLLEQAHAAQFMGFNFRLDFYTAPISDDEDKEEAHLLVWKELRADARITGA
jgi:hypothetical protein